ncbi:MAG: tetratricopeptide repeat protein [Fimbriimonadales bacterium]
MGDPRMLIQQAIALKNEGRYDEAEQLLKQALTINPHSSEAHHQLGLVYCFTGMFDESIQELETSVRLDPEAVQPRLDLALTYSMLGYEPEAKRELEEVLRRDPANEMAQRQIVYFK